MTTETENALAGGDDAALFDEMTSPAVADAPEAVAPVIETPKAPPAELGNQPSQEREQNRVPLSELMEERRNRQALEKQMQALIATMQANQPKPPQTPEPDVWDDPTAFVQRQINPAIEQQKQAAFYNARLIAEARFGEDNVTKAQVEFDRLYQEGRLDPLEHSRVMNSPNPFAEAVKWHKRQTVVSEVGDDITAYQAKLKAQLLDDPDFRKEMMAKLQQQAGGMPQGRSTPSISLPSLSKVGATSLPSGDGASSDVDLWNSVTSTKRR